MIFCFCLLFLYQEKYEKSDQESHLKSRSEPKELSQFLITGGFLLQSCVNIALKSKQTILTY